MDPTQNAVWETGQSKVSWEAVAHEREVERVWRCQRGFGAGHDEEADQKWT